MAEIGAMPATVMAPKVRKVPPPAIALTAPDRKPLAKSSRMIAMDITPPELSICISRPEIPGNWVATDKLLSRKG